MLRALRANLSYANVMSTIAVFIVLGGGAYAASTLPSNSVGNAQIQKYAVSTSKVANGAIINTKIPAQGITTSRYANNSIINTKVQNGTLVAADLNPAFLASLQVSGALPAGATLRGRYSVRSVNNPEGADRLNTGIAFGFTLASAPAETFVAVGQAAPAQCPGNVASPAAAPGNFCIYEGSGANHGAVSITNAAGTANTADAFGAALSFPVTAANAVASSAGSWAVQGPAG